MQYQLYLNLRQRAALKTAVSFWGNKEIKDKTAKFFEPYDNLKIRKVQSKWREFTKSVIDEWNKDLLPRKLEAELIHIVKMIGETIFFWYQNMKHEYKTIEEKRNSIDEIKWTPYGTVDVVQIFKSSWLENLNLDITKVYNFACTLALEEHIDDLWQQIPKDIQDNHYKDVYEVVDRHILAYWKCHRDNDLPNFTENINEAMGNLSIDPEENPEEYDRLRSLMNCCEYLYNLDFSAEENLLRFSVHGGFFFATKYFWNKLTQEKKNRNILECVRLAVTYSHHFENLNEPIEGFIREKYVEICIFLMNQMTDAHKRIFFNETTRVYIRRIESYEILDMKDEILRMLLSIWPWQEMFIPVLKDMLEYLDDHEMSCMFLDAITSKMVEDHKLGYSLETSRYRSLLWEAWLIIPPFIKYTMVFHEFTLRFVSNLVSVSDLDSLKLILNDPDIANVRDEFIFDRFKVYEQLICNGQFEILNEFMNKILKTEEYKEALRAFIDFTSVCKIFVLNQRYDLLNKFIDWISQKEEEKINYEDVLKTDKFLIQRVYKIWRWFRRYVDDAKHESSRFLVWALRSNEEVTRFKREKLVNLEVNQLDINELVELNSDGNMDEFLSWCSLNDEQVQQIKQTVFQENVRLLQAHD